MKWYFVIVALLLGCLGAPAQGSDDQYISIYSLIQEAGKLNSGGQPGEALEKYREAQTALQQFQKHYPQWNPNVISFRLNDVAAKIAEMSSRVSAATTSAPGTAATSPTAAPMAKTAPSDWETKLAGLTDQVRQLQADKAVLESKLKEALSVQPAAMDPRELARAEERIRNLQKENDLFKVSLAQEKAKASQVPDTNAVAETRQALAVANRKLADQTKAVNALTLEKKALSADVKAATAMRAENRLLKKQLADLKSAPPSPAKADEASHQLALARAQIAALQSDKEMLQLEKTALENRVKPPSAQAATAVAAPVPAKAADASQIKQLERERDDLRKQLNAANKELYGRKSKEAVARLKELENQLASLRARLEVYEARQTPYTAEELALFKQPETKPPEADRKTAGKSVKEPPPGTVALVAEANRYYASRKLDQAEEKYLQVLRQDNKNVTTLATLAAIQLDLDHLDAAETNITQAVTLAPDDAYSLFVLGRLRFHQKKYDEAIEVFGRAAKLDPQDAETQNFLGLALSEKGLRGPAETALRKAIQLKPGYANAHNNLAVVYITQQPPLVELARWHYQKALAAGAPHNLELEKMLDAKKPTDGGQ
jgi:Flp pilus assembly protein TadD